MQKDLESLLYINLAIIVILLSLFNLTGKAKKETAVLGSTIDNTYWEELVKTNPTYIDAWVELERMDMVRQIDPNYSQIP